MTNRKLQAEIDRVLKRVIEGIEEFESIWQKVQSAPTPNLKEKYEGDLKKEIKKLQRYRDQIKSWASSSDVKNKKPLLDARKQIETQMERFKVLEKETKTKAYSKEGLSQIMRGKKDPKKDPKFPMCGWLDGVRRQLKEQIEELEGEIEQGRHKQAQDETQSLIDRHSSHIEQLHRIRKRVERDQISVKEVEEIKEAVEYYVSNNQDPDFVEDMGLYDGLAAREDIDVVRRENKEHFAAREAERQAAGGHGGPKEEGESDDEELEDDSEGDDDGTDDSEEEESSEESSDEEQERKRAAASARRPTKQQLAQQQAKERAEQKAKAAAAAAAAKKAKAAGSPQAALTPPGAVTPTAVKPPSAVAARSTAVDSVPPRAGVKAPPVAIRGKPVTPAVGAAAPSSSSPLLSGSGMLNTHGALNVMVPKAPVQPKQLGKPSPGPGAPGETMASVLLRSKQAEDRKRAAASAAAAGHPSPLVSPVSAGASPALLAQQHPLASATFAPLPAATTAPPVGGGAVVKPVVPATAPGPAPSAVSAGAVGPVVPKRKLAVEVPPLQSQQPQPGPRGLAQPVGAPKQAPSPAVQSIPLVPLPQPQQPRDSVTPRGAGARSDSGAAVTQPHDAAAGGSNALDLANPAVAGAVGASPVIAPGIAAGPAPGHLPLQQLQQQHLQMQQQQLQQQQAGGAAAAGPAKRPQPGSGIVSDEYYYTLSLLEPSLRHLPDPQDSSRPKPYLARNPYRTPNYFPSLPAPVFDDPAFFEKLSFDTLFFIFYFQQGTPQQYLAARELKKQSWRYHKKYLTWFQRHEDPKHTTDEYEQGTYVYFDFENSWCQRIKADFTFEYRHLEDALAVPFHSSV